ncbi:MAG: DNA polymerase III subunit delta [Thermodesulfobacteriota bacterium]|nr:DNA polymerase III subunit delta [Thermodesulfobacteriota bacterium]
MSPEKVLGQLEKGKLSPFYLFYGESGFLLEKVLNRIRETLIPEPLRDLNLQVFFGDKQDQIDPLEIIDAARTLPFMSQNKLIIMRRPESFPTASLESFVPYLEKPVESTCLIFVSSKPDFRKKFFSKIRKYGCAVNFQELYPNQVVPWIKKTAKEMGFNLEEDACACLQQIVGNRMMDLCSELEKLFIRYGEKEVGIKEVKELAIYTRTYTVFELMDTISYKQGAESIPILKKLVEEEGRDGILKLMGMLNRQIRLLWQTKSIIEEGGRSSDVARKLSLRDFQVKPLLSQSSLWNKDELERAFHLLYEADGLLKSNSQEQQLHLILENVVLSLFSSKNSPLRGKASWG